VGDAPVPRIAHAQADGTVVFEVATLFRGRRDGARCAPPSAPR
jgi:hypothetical protein